MKNTISWLAPCFIISTLLNIACRDKDKQPLTINLSLKTITAPFTGSTDTVYIVNTNETPKDWNIVANDEWLIVEKINHEKFTVKTPTNYTPNTRNSKLEIKASNAFGELYITQKAVKTPAQALDSLGLVALYDQNNGKEWYFEGDLDPKSKHVRWNFYKPFTQWVGVETALIEGQWRVVRLDLSDRQIKGTLPNEIFHCQHLEQFIAPQNTFDINVFAQLDKFETINYIDLSYNNMSGDIPASIGDIENLAILEIAGNSWTSDFPAQIQNCKKLAYLNAQGCGAPFKVASLQHNTELIDLNLSFNQMNGSTLSTIGNLSKLEILNLSGNQIEGCIPPTIGELTNLKELLLAFNAIEGEIPSTFSQLKNLEIVNLTENKLTSIANQTINSQKLTSLDLSFNNLKTIDINWAKNTQLEELNLYQNEITDIQGDFSHLTTLSTINIGNNNLSQLPLAIEKCTKLTQIYAPQNNLKTIPSFQNLKNLTSIDLSNNKIEGKLPLWIGILNSLRTVNLANNNFTGTIPLNVILPPNLFTFVVRGNRLSGEIPDIVKKDARFSGKTIKVPTEDDPNILVDIFVPGVWQPEVYIIPQQEGFGFKANS